MSANETFELAVQLRGEGLDETKDGLEDVEGTFDDTADSVDDSADEMEGFASQWDGAMMAIVGGLAIAATGLLTQVPIVGELMSGLNAIISAVAFQIDQVLRPVLAPVSDGMFNLADSIYEADGAAGTIIGVLAILAVSLIAVGVAAQFATFVWGGLTSAYLGMAAVKGAVVGAIQAIAAALGISTLAVVGIIAAIIALIAIIAILATDFMGIRTAIVDSMEGIHKALVNIGEGITNFFTNLAKDAIQWGQDLVKNFAEGILNSAGMPVDAARSVMADIGDKLSFDQRENDRMAQRWGQDMLSHFSIGMEKGVKHELPTDGINPTGDSGPQRPATGDGDVQVLLDGRRVDKGVRRHRGNETGPRGRHS